MKKGDLLWLGALGLVVVYLLGFTEQFNGLTKAFPYPMGFLKFFILATMGEILAIRIVTGDYKKPVGLVWRAVVWGFFGMIFVFIFPLFAAGVKDAAAKGLLPKIIYAKGMAGAFGFAFFTSMIMNLAFAPTFMAFHRVTDTYIDMGNGNLSEIFKLKMNDVVGKIDWKGFISFVVCKISGLIFFAGIFFYEIYIIAVRNKAYILAVMLFCVNKSVFRGYCSYFGFS